MLKTKAAFYLVFNDVTNHLSPDAVWFCDVQQADVVISPPLLRWLTAGNPKTISAIVKCWAAFITGISSVNTVQYETLPIKALTSTAKSKYNYNTLA